MSEVQFQEDRGEKLKELQLRMHACRSCPLESHYPVFEGDINDRVMVIGQAPGRHRGEPHRPFSEGSGGKKLFRWLEQSGFGEEEEARSSIYFTALAKCFPGPSKSGHGDQPPSKDQLRQCGPFLDEEIRLVKPRIIIPVGKMAIERILGKHTLTEVVGKSFEVDLDGFSSTIIPLPHPSGASLWNNLPENKALVEKALEILSHAKSALG